MIERDESPAMPDRERKQVGIRYLSRAVDPRWIDDALIEQADVIRPELVKRGCACLPKTFRNCDHGTGIGIARMRNDPDATILRDRARSPAAPGVGSKPLRCAHMQGMILIQQRNQYVYVEQRPHQ